MKHHLVAFALVTLGRASGRGKPRRDGRSDIHAEDSRGGGLERDHALIGERHGDGGRGGGRLDDYREDERNGEAAQESAKGRRIEGGEELERGLALLERPFLSLDTGY